MEEKQEVELKKGLKDVYIDRTQSSLIDGKKGRLYYRGYSIHDLAERSTFEETTYLLFYGDLPTRRQLSDFSQRLKEKRSPSRQVLEFIRQCKGSHPMDALRTAVSAVGTLDGEAGKISTETTLKVGVQLTALSPAIVAAHTRISEGKEPVEPDAELGHAANFLYMLFGKRASPEDARLIDKDLILHAEHGLNASTFGARVAASTQANPYSAVVAGLAILQGPLHGGAAEGVMRQAIEIGTPENVKPYLDNHRNLGGRVMGFGHRVYTKVDPRATHLEADARLLGERVGQSKWIAILDAITEYMAPYTRRGIVQNVDFWSGAIYNLLGIPENLYVPIFALGRIPGWILHVSEQYESNMILRPRLQYVGPTDREYVPIDERDETSLEAIPKKERLAGRGLP